MLEQLKDVIVEMALLIKDCCLPVISTKERNIKDETNPGKNLDENDRSLTVDCDNRGPYIRMDSFLRKIFSPSFYEPPCAHECDEERNPKKSSSLYRLKSNNVPPIYESLFSFENDTKNTNTIYTNMVELPLKYGDVKERFENQFNEEYCHSQDNNSKSYQIGANDQRTESNLALCINEKVTYRNYVT